MVYNPLTCAGWATADAGMRVSMGGPCMMSKLLAVILFFVFALIKKWGGEEAGLEFSLVASSIVGILAFLIIVILTGGIKIPFIIGVAAGVAAGYGGGAIFQGELP